MTAREAIAEMRDMVSDRHADYHTEEDALRYLNRAAQYVSNESESVRSGLYRPVIEGQGTYGMRADVLQIDFVGFKGQNENQYTPLTPLRNIGAETINRNSENARPIYYSLWGRSAVEKFLGVVVTAPADGAFTLNIDGAPADLKAGDIIQNVSDREAQATLTAVEYRSNDILLQHGLTVGGENGTIAAEDEVRISSPDQGRQTIHISPPPDFTSDDGEENLFIYYAHKHRIITQANIDDTNDDLEIDPQLEEAFLHRMSYHAATADKNVADSTADLFDGKYNYYYKRAMPRVRQKLRQFQSLWFAGQTTSQFRDVNLVGYTNQFGHTGNSYRIL